MQNCGHSEIQQFELKFYCKDCGVHLPEDGSRAIVENKSPCVLNPLQNLKAQWRRGVPIGQLPMDYQKQRSNLIDYMTEWAEKLKLSNNSLFLSIGFLDYYLSNKKVDPVSYKLYAATCLMLAAKSIELDERIPFISKLRRYTYLPYGTMDFRRCECQLIKQLNWNLQCTTIYDWAEAAISLGIVYECDEAPVLKEKNMNIIQQKTDNMKDHIESLFKKDCSLLQRVTDALQKLCINVLKDGSYLDKDPQEITVSLIAAARKNCQLVALPPALAKLYTAKPTYIENFMALGKRDTCVRV